MYFEAQTKKILACEFGSNERFSVDNRHEAAMGFHCVLPKTEKDIDFLRDHEEKLNRTPEDTVTYDLITKLQKIEKGKKEPTVERSTFRKALTDFGILLRVMFCPNAHSLKPYGK